MNTGNRYEGIDVFEFFKYLLKHLKLFLVISSCILMLLVLFISFRTPTYRATSTISIIPLDNLTNWNGQKIKKNSIDDELRYLKNINIIKNALNELDLTSYSSDVNQYLIADQYLESLINSINTSGAKDTQSVTVWIENADKDFAFDFLNSLLKSFEIKLNDLKELQFSDEKKQLEERIDTIEKKINIEKNEFTTLQDIEEYDQIKDDITFLLSQTQALGSSSFANALVYIQRINPSILEKIDPITLGQSLLVEHLAQLNNLESFIGTSMNPISIIDEVRVVDNQEPSDSLIAIIGFIISIIISSFIVIIVEMKTDSINDYSIFLRITGNNAPILSRITCSRDNIVLKNLNKTTNSDPSPFINLASLLQNLKRQNNIFMICSLGSGENSTNTTLMIAQSLFKIGKRVLVIGANDNASYEKEKSFNKKSQHKIYDIFCVSDFNVELLDLDLNKNDKIELLSLKHYSNNLVQLIGDPRFSTFIESMKDSYDIVLIDGPYYKDTPSVLGFAKLIDGIILNVHSYTSSRKYLINLLHSFQLCEIQITGFIYNELEGKPPLFCKLS